MTRTQIVNGRTYLKCQHCNRPFIRHPSDSKRRTGAFCSRPCWLACLKAFTKTYRRKVAEDLEKAASILAG